jgi:hypothetical protein
MHGCLSLCFCVVLSSVGRGVCGWLITRPNLGCEAAKVLTMTVYYYYYYLAICCHVIVSFERARCNYKLLSEVWRIGVWEAGLVYCAYLILDSLTEDFHVLQWVTNDCLDRQEL